MPNIFYFSLVLAVLAELCGFIYLPAGPPAPCAAPRPPTLFFARFLVVTPCKFSCALPHASPSLP